MWMWWSAFSICTHGRYRRPRRQALAVVWDLPGRTPLRIVRGCSGWDWDRIFKPTNKPSSGKCPGARLPRVLSFQSTRNRP